LVFSFLIISLAYVNVANAQIVINANDRGWYNVAGTHNPGNNNTYTGFLSQNYHSYFRFSIPAGITCLSNAVLELELENHYGGAQHTAHLHDVTSANVPLLDTQNGSGNGVVIHTDLGSGVSYGTQAGITSADVGTIFSYTLPAAALTNIAAASGSDFAVGSRTTSTSTASFWGLRYSAGSEPRVHRLTITECPSLPDIKAKKSVTVFDPGALGLYALPGNDAIYTITVVNTGAGSVDNDTMVLIDKIPDETIFYNGDIDDGGPETDPVSFQDASSGLTFNYVTDVAYSDLAATPANFAACTYVPSVGYDPNVEHICLNPKGIMGTGSPPPQFSVSLRVNIK